MAMPYRNDKDNSFLESFATAMLRSRTGSLTEFATLLRFQYGARGFHRQYERLTYRRDELKRVLRNEMQTHLENKSGLTLAMFDDTSIKKTGKQFDGQGVHHDHTNGAYYTGFNVCSTAVYKHGKTGVVDTVFASKDESKLDQCNSAFTALCEDIDPDVFLFDAWFSLEPVLRTLNTLDKAYVTRFKSNRIAIIDDDRISLRILGASIDHNQYESIRISGKTYWVLDITLELNGLGPQRVILSKEQVHSKPIFLTTNHAGFSTKFVLKLYMKRWHIELFFKDAKQFLNLETFQCRSKRKWELHLTLVHIMHWCLQRRHSISKTVRQIRESVGKIQSYLNQNCLFRRFLDAFQTRCQT